MNKGDVFEVLIECTVPVQGLSHISLEGRVCEIVGNAVGRYQVRVWDTEHDWVVNAWYMGWFDHPEQYKLLNTAP